MLTDASIEGKVDHLLGLKENVIIGKLIPAATGLKRYRQIGIGPSDSVPAHLYARPETEAELLAALEEIGGDGDGLDLGGARATFGGRRGRRRRRRAARSRRGDRGPRGRLAARRRRVEPSEQIDERGRPRGRPRRFRACAGEDNGACARNPALLRYLVTTLLAVGAFAAASAPAGAAGPAVADACGLPRRSRSGSTTARPADLGLRTPRRDRRRLGRRLPGAGAVRRRQDGLLGHVPELPGRDADEAGRRRRSCPRRRSVSSTSPSSRRAVPTR